MEQVVDTTSSLENLLSESALLRSLATLGIANAVFGHETENSIEAFSTAVEASLSLLNGIPPDVDGAVLELGKATKHASRVHSWGSFSLARVKRDKRTKRSHNVSTVIGKLVKELKPAFDAVRIDLVPSLQGVTIKCFAVDIETIALNLLSNAYWFCQAASRAREVHISVGPGVEAGRAGMELVVSDSGVGVAKEHQDRIWDPMFTTKTNRRGKQVGTGLGLTIVRSTTEELGGKVDYSRDSKLKGARFRVWIPA